MRRRRIAFFYEFAPGHMPSYVARDFEALSRMADVTWHASLAGRGWSRGIGPRGWLPDARVRNAVSGADLVVQWFAVPSAPVLAARLFGRPSLVVAGGYDVAAVPEIHYGRMLGFRTRLMGRLALESASRVLCVSQFNEREARRFAPRANTAVLLHGFDPDSFSTGVKRPEVVTVGALRLDYLERKGLLAFARASRLLPDVPFVLIGRLVDEEAARRVRETGGPNLLLAGEVSDAELRLRLAQSAIYAQLSVHEAFGCAVAEAMLAGCTPVVTRAGALPEVVGDAGHYAPSREAEAVAATITQALSAPLGVAARERVLRRFPWTAREQGLRRHVEALVPSESS